MKLQVDDLIRLEFSKEIHALELLHLVNENRAYLKEWMPWVDEMQTVLNFRHYISNCKKMADNRTDYSFGIIISNIMVGRIGIHRINLQNKIGEIGYWLSSKYQGQGIITRCCKKLIEHGFAELELNRIEIKCGTGNSKSQAIPEKLKFTREGILRQAELLNGKYIDLYLYSLLKDEWK